MLRVLSLLSTAMLPPGVALATAINETALMQLAPRNMMAFASSVGQHRAAADRPELQGYSGSKWHRMLLSKKLSETTPGLQAVTLVPSNVFGPDANCSASGPLLNALIAKAIGAAQGISSQMVVAGSGNPLRQVLYSHDLARVLLWAIENFDDVSTPLFVSGDERTVSSLAKLAAKTAGFLGQLVFDKNYPDGPLRRAVSSAKLKSLMKDRLSWTPLNHAIVETIRSCTKTGVSLT